jgi:hypothetical protein
LKFCSAGGGIGASSNAGIGGGFEIPRAFFCAEATDRLLESDVVTRAPDGSERICIWPCAPRVTVAQPPIDTAKIMTIDRPIISAIHTTRSAG